MGGEGSGRKANPVNIYTPTRTNIASINSVPLELPNLSQIKVNETWTPGSVCFIGSDGKIHQDNSNLFWDDTNNRLGILTNAPSAALHVNGNARAARWDSGDGTVSTPALFFNADPDTGIRRITTNAISLVAAGADGLWLSGANTTINGSLDFNANINNINKGIYWKAVGDGGFGSLWRETSTGNLYLDAQTSHNLVIGTQNTGQKVGIGTASPSNQLTIRDASGNWLAGQFGATESFTLSDNGTNVVFATPNITTDRGFTFSTYTGEKVRITKDGNVGIGTTAPDQGLNLGSGAFGIANSTAPTLTLTVSSGALFVSGGQLWFKGGVGTQTLLAAA